MADDKEVLFSSFMAGLLLCRKSMTYSDLCTEISFFENEGHTLIEPDGDFNQIAKVLEERDNAFILKYDYNEIINNNITVYDYLYYLTDMEVRRYYGIPEKEVTNTEDNDNVVIRKRKLFDKFKRVKAIG